MVTSADGAVARYYATPAVRARLQEYCGASTDDARPTCRGVAGLEARVGRWPQWEEASPQPPGELGALAAGGLDLARTLQDRRALLVHLDLDYQNTTAPAEPFVHPIEVFLKLEPVFDAVRALCAHLGLRHRVLMTGRGYHVAAQVPLEGPVTRRLAALAPEEPAWHATCPERRPGWADDDLSADTARAWTGLGLILEHAAHEVLRAARARAVLPVVLDGTSVGDVSLAGHECASVDLSAFGDPLDTRFVRLAFSSYQLHRLRPDIFGAAVATRVPPFAAVPRTDDDGLLDLLQHGRTLEAAARRADTLTSTLPDCSAGLGRLIDEYEAAPLRAVHRGFYAERPAPPAAWPDTYDRLDASTLPGCVARALGWPNDRLLQPAAIQHVTRVLLARGWHARDIAGLVWSRYAKDFDWGPRWRRMDAPTRADFDVRVFADLVAVGLDEAVDLNCVSAQEKGLCPMGGCTHDLRLDRARLLARHAS